MAPVTPVVTGTKIGAQFFVVVCEHVDALDELRFAVGQRWQVVADRCAVGLPAFAARAFLDGGITLDQRLDGDGEGVRACGRW